MLGHHVPRYIHPLVLMFCESLFPINPSNQKARLRSRPELISCTAACFRFLSGNSVPDWTTTTIPRNLDDSQDIAAPQD